MPTKPSQILAALQGKAAAFKTFDQTALQLLHQYRETWLKFVQHTPAELQQTFDRHPELSAYPLESFREAPEGIQAESLNWRNREESLAWVRDRLTGIATFAVDGSQIYPSRDISIPVALIQIGWFENFHLPEGRYHKDIALDVMAPAELQGEGNLELVDRRVNMRRFQMETDRLIAYMAEKAHSPSCLVFFDGSLIATFAEAFDPETRRFYVHCLLRLLRASETHRVPLVGYIDNSFAKDLVGTLQQMFLLPEASQIHDAQLLNLFFKERWGDRTPLFRCQRSGILSEYEDQARRVAFTYLKTTHDHPPARLEFPLWLHEAGRVNEVMDWVRGEVIIGGGYPYAIETADQVAVLQAEDRQVFYRVLQDWADQEQLKLRLSRKLISKVRRR